MTEKHLGYRYRASAIGYPDLGTYSEILHGGLDQLFGPGRAIDMDRLGALAIPRQGHQRTETRCVVVMVVRNKNQSDLSDINTSLCQTACGAVAGINDIMRAVDG
jgi:hypothetical protein